MEEEKTVLSLKDPDTITADDTLIDADWNSDSTTSESERHSRPQDEDNWPDEDIDDLTAMDEPQADQSYQLKYMGQEIDVSQDEMITLAQKGKDYDRIRSRADELTTELEKTNGYSSFLDELAQKTGQSREAFIDSARSALSINNGLTDARANGNDLQIPSAVLRTSSGTELSQEKEKIQRGRDVEAFLAEYKTVDPSTIPTEVWDGVRAGKPLLGAYQSFENKRLKAQLESEKKSLENKQKTTRSRQSSGGVRSRGEIEDDWYKGE